MTVLNKSVLKNPLDEFHTYSVHYVLLACRTTIDASKFADDQNANSTLDAVNNTHALGDPVVFGDSQNDVFLVIDTRRFSQFTIDELKYDVHVNALTKGGSTSNLATDLTMTVIDSVGISFAHFMQYLMDQKLKTNFDGLVFMLRTIFVGQNEDGSTKTIQTETIPMHLLSMDIDLNYAKGIYKLEFMPNLNFDVRKNRRFLSVGMSTTYSTGKGNELGGLIQNFELRLNENSKKFYDDVQRAVAGARVGGGRGTQGLAAEQKAELQKPYGRLVKYQITIPEQWKKFTVQGPADGKKTETKFTNKAGVDTVKIVDSNFSTYPGAAITDILDSMFSQVPDVARMGNFKTQESAGADSDVITFYKFFTGLTSSKTELCVHVNVVEFKVPNIIARSKNSSAVSGDAGAYRTESVQGSQRVERRVPKDLLEYDYIFTGKNKDVLNFDMKIQDFNVLLASNLKIGPEYTNTAADSGTVPDQATKQSSRDALGTREYDPILMPADTQAALKAFSNLAGVAGKKDQDATAAHQQYKKNLSMFWAGSPVQTSITIKGNPLIMHKFNLGMTLLHPAGEGSAGGVGTAGTKEAYRKDLEDRILGLNKGLTKSPDGSLTANDSILSEASYAVSPVFVKLNVSGPAVDFRTNEENSPPYSVSILSDQYYTVFRLTNVIRGHAFTQDLELYSHNVFAASADYRVKKND